MKIIHNLKLLLLLPLTLVLLLALALVYSNIYRLGQAHDTADHAQLGDLEVIAGAALFSSNLGSIHQRVMVVLQGAQSGELNELQLYRLHSSIVDQLDLLRHDVNALASSGLVQDANHGSARGLLDAFAAYQRFVIMTTDVLAVDPAVAAEFMQQAQHHYADFSIFTHRISERLAHRSIERNQQYGQQFAQLMQRLLWISLGVLILVFAVSQYASRHASSNMLDVADALRALAHSPESHIELPRIEYLHAHSQGELHLITGKLLEFRHALQRQREAEEKAFQLAFYDVLTRLPNRRLLSERVQQAIGESQRHAGISALLVFDLDAFKQINNTLGHSAGDQLLTETASRLTQTTKSTDTVARIGSNAFAVLLPALGSNKALAASRATQISERLNNLIQEPVLLDGEPFFVTASTGITLFDADATDSDQPQKQAEAAMYRAKEEGRGKMRFFDARIQACQEHRSALENDLRWALELQQLRLFYQLQVDVNDHARGVEALLRWLHPQRGMVSPAEFIPLAESSDLILPIGNWVLQHACQQLAGWSGDPGFCSLSIAVNVSARQFMQPDFVENVQQILTDTQAPAHRLKLEITESLVISDIDNTIEKMHALRALGIQLSLDDFGTGYSSLQYLRRMPLDQLKIEQSFARDLTTDSHNAAIVQAIIAMGRALNIEVIAEGVETEEQRNFLFQQQCTLYQGYLYSKPVALDDLQRLISQRYSPG